MTLELKDISFSRNETCLFSKINCTVHPGQMLQIMGANGCGKSTLLRIVAGFLTPTSGEIFWQGSFHYLGHQNSLKPHLTVGDNLKLFASLKKQNLPSTLLKEVMVFLDIQHLLLTKVMHLSAGQLRRVSLAKLFIFKAPLWILDEPLTALDIQTQEKITHFFAQHLNNNGMILVATHHQLSFANHFSVIKLT